MQQFEYIRRFRDLGIDDVPLVGGKNASLGEMYQTLSGEGVMLPNVFTTTAQAYLDYLAHNGLRLASGMPWNTWMSMTSMRWPQPVRRYAAGLSMQNCRPDWSVRSPPPTRR